MDTDFSMLSFKLAVFLMIMFVMMILFFIIIKRIKGGSLTTGKYPLMRNLASLSLGPRRSLALVEVCEQWILIGVGSENISLISKIDRPSGDTQFESGLPQEGNIFDSFLSKAGLKQLKPDSRNKKNEQ